MLYVVFQYTSVILFQFSNLDIMAIIWLLNVVCLLVIHAQTAYWAVVLFDYFYMSLIVS